MLPARLPASQRAPSLPGLRSEELATNDEGRQRLKGARRRAGKQSRVTSDAVPLDETRLTPSPPVTESDAAEAILACYGLSGELTRLPGEADDNFLLDTADHGRYVVKFAHLRADPAVVGAQVRVLRHIESTAPGLPVPRVLAPLEQAAPSGQPWTVVPDGPLRGRVVHALSYLDGRLLKTVTTDPPLRRAMGGILAELGQALRGFDDPLVRRPLLWDLAQLPQLRPLAAERSTGPRTDLLTAQLGRLTAETSPRLAAQRTQVLHNDFSPDNTLISADGTRVAGIIDFGDVIVTALVNDVAIAAAYLLGDDADPVGPALDFIAGYHAVSPLTEAELALLPDLILGRVVARIVISEWRAERFPANRGYVLRNTPRAWDQLDRLLSIPAGQFAARILEATRA